MTPGVRSFMSHPLAQYAVPWTVAAWGLNALGFFRKKTALGLGRESREPDQLREIEGLTDKFPSSIDEVTGLK
jgi:hypothetical protein